MPQTTPITQDDARRFYRVFLAKEMGWTLEYVDGLNTQDFYDTLGVITAFNRHKTIEMEAARFRAQSRKGKKW